MEWSDKGIILAVRSHGETSAIIEVLTPGLGRHAGLVKGARSRTMRPVLQPGNIINVTWRARLADHLGHFAVVETLIQAGAPLDHINNLNWTALIEAIVLGDGGPQHIATLKALVDAGADVNLADGSGRTPLQLAQARGYHSMVKILLDAGAK